MKAAVIASRAIEEGGLSPAEALTLASDCELSALLEAAARVRNAGFGDEVSFCAIVNARSGSCSEDCRYCAQSSHYRTGVGVFGLLSADEVLRAAESASAEGATCFGIVTSGATCSHDEVAVICEAVRRIKAASPLAVSASLGRLDRESLRALKEAGLDRFHHNLETSRAFFPNICSTHSWDERLETLALAREEGIELCSGGLFGLGESWEDRVSLAATLRSLDVRSVPVNFLNPIPSTPFGSLERLGADEALRIVALFRLMLPRATVRVCGGRRESLGERQREIFAAGANALMTGNYLTTAGAAPSDDRRMVEELGFRLEAKARPR